MMSNGLALLTVHLLEHVDNDETKYMSPLHGLINPSMGHKSTAKVHAAKLNALAILKSY